MRISDEAVELVFEEEVEKNKFQIKGLFKSSGGGGIPIPFNATRGSVRVTANGQLLVEGIDYTVNYAAGRVEILDQALIASNTPISVDVENNALFGQQTRRFTGINVEHQFNDNFLLGATLLNLNERPITQKANFDAEPINNTIFGFNGNFATEVPFFTRLVNKLPNIDTDAPSNLSVNITISFTVRHFSAFISPKRSTSSSVFIDRILQVCINSESTASRALSILDILAIFF